MARLQGIEYDQSSLSANPWEEELQKRDKKEKDNDEEDIENIQSSHHNIGALPSRGIPMMEAGTQKGLSLIFGKVDRQIELLDKQVNTIQAELLQARNLVKAVRNSVANLNKPEASNLLEKDVFTNYLRIADRLKAISNNIFMIIPDHGRQIVRAHESYTYNPGFVNSYSDLGESYPELSIDGWTTRTVDESRYYNGNGLFKSTDVESSYSESVSSDYTSDLNVSPPLSRSPTREWYAPNRTSYTHRPSPPPRVVYDNDRRRRPILRDRHTVRFARRPLSRVSSESSSREIYDSLTDSFYMKDKQREKFIRPYHRYPNYPSKRRPLTPTRISSRSSFIASENIVFEPREWQVNEKSQIPLEEPSVLSAMPKFSESTRMAVRAAGRRHRPLSYDLETNEEYGIKPRERWDEEEIEIPRVVSVYPEETQHASSPERTLEEPRLISVDPKKKRQAFSSGETVEEPQLVSVDPKKIQQAFSLEAILHEERTLLLEKLYKVQEQLEAAQGRPIVKSPTRDGDDDKGSFHKEKFWTRLRSKFADHSKKQDDIM